MRIKSTAKCLDCDFTAVARGYCGKHYASRKSRGEFPNRRERIFWKTMKEKFDHWWMPLTEVSCWLWIGPNFVSGYGQICDPETKKNRKSNRVSFELYNGPIPEGQCVCHRCDNKWCVNPDHLFLGTSKENTDDKVRKGRQNRGLTHGMVKLSEESVRAIRASSESLTFLGHKHNVTAQNIFRIKHRKTWRHIQ